MKRNIKLTPCRDSAMARVAVTQQFRIRVERNGAASHVYCRGVDAESALALARSHYPDATLTRS